MNLMVDTNYQNGKIVRDDSGFFSVTFNICNHFRTPKFVG